MSTQTTPTQTAQTTTNHTHAETQEPTIRELLTWLTSITRPVHKPLYISTVLRIINLLLDIALFALAGASIMAAITAQPTVWILLACLFAAAILKAAAYYGEQFSGHYVAFKALELLRTYVFSQLWPKAPAITAHSRSGDVLTSITRDVDRIEVVYAHTFAPVISAYIVPTLTLCVTGAWIGWDIIAIPAICVALSLFVTPFLGLRSTLRRTHDTLSKRRTLVHHLTDSVFGTEEIVSYGREQQRIQATEELANDVSYSASLPTSIAGIRRALNLALMLISTCGLIYMGIKGGYTLTTIVVLASGSLRLFVGPVGVEDATAYLDYAFAAAKRLWSLCHAEAAVHDGETVLHLDAAPSITFDNVSYAYPHRTTPEDTQSETTSTETPWALRNINIQIPAGKRTVFLGVSGSGKSTAMQLLLRYDDPTHGTIRIGDTDITTCTLDSLRTNVVSVAQKNQLLDSTIRTNVTLGAPDATDDDIWNALQAAGIADEIRAMEHGLDEPVGQAGTRLSGGQAQRLCLARALIMKPSVLVLDEFTSSLNIELEAQIRTAIATALPGVTTIEVTHRVESALDSDYIVLLDKGEILAQGTPSEVAHLLD